jgi:hypothetical protein
MLQQEQGGGDTDLREGDGRGSGGAEAECIPGSSPGAVCGRRRRGRPRAFCRSEAGRHGVREAAVANIIERSEHINNRVPYLAIAVRVHFQLPFVAADLEDVAAKPLGHVNRLQRCGAA